MSTTIPNTTAPTNNDYGGDEVSALVLDPGCSTTRAGFAGEDAPKSVVPTAWGSTQAQPFLFGDNAVHTPQAGLDVRSPMAKDGTVEDWDAAAKLWQYTITSRLMVPRQRHPYSNGLNDPSEEQKDAMDLDGMDDMEGGFLGEHPLLMTEPGWNPTKHREKSIEIAMEDWGCPAFWLARNGVLSAFANGKSSALVIDTGASSTAVTSVHDGIQLRKGSIRCPLAGDFLSTQIRHLFASSTPPVPLHPYYLVTGKSAVDAGVPASATYRTYPEGAAPAQSFRVFQEERVLHEFKETVVQVWPGPNRFTAASQGLTADELVARAGPPRPFELPDGFNQVFGADRFRVAEALFDPRAALGPPEQAPQPAQGIPNALAQAIGQVDSDIKANMLSNVVVVGGTSLTSGFNDRLLDELQQLYSGTKVRLHSPGNTYERKFSSWVGGSILASLGTFHQMWISKKEYEEQGPNVVEKRCK